MGDCFLCDMRKFVKKWKPLVSKIEYGTPKDSQLCKKCLDEFIKRMGLKFDKNNGVKK